MPQDMAQDRAQDRAHDRAAALTIDARGHRCPMPTLRLRRALEAATAGQRVTLLADDPLVRIDAPHFLAAAGHRLVSITATDGVITIIAEKSGEDDSSGA